MMKKAVSALIFCSLLSLASFEARAQDGLFGDARTVDYTRFSAGIQPIVYTEPGSEFMMMFRSGYGITPELSFEGKVGVFREHVYVGGHLKYRLLTELMHPITMSILGGAYIFQDIGFKLSGIMSKNLGQFSLYTGLSFEPIFSVPAQASVLIPVGVDIPVTPKTAFIFEADLAVNDVAKEYQALHFGLKFRL